MLKEHCLVMQFLGKDGVAAHTLRSTNKPEKERKADYRQTIDVGEWFDHCRLR